MTPTDDDATQMAAALALARRGLGRVAPNPAVGCLLVRDGVVVGRGWTQPGGRPHAETEALRRAGSAAQGATAYVTLEPCAHHGVTPPCSDALIDAGIARCVIACPDPDERVDGRGAAALRRAGVTVEIGLLRRQAEALNRGFLLHRVAGRPMVTLKLASTLDGRIATAEGESRWITGPAARARGHLLRAMHDAVLVGSGTALADDPRLDVRLPGFAPNRPLRVVLDGRLRLRPGCDLIDRAGEQPTRVVTTAETQSEAARALAASGVELLRLPSGEDRSLDPAAVLRALAAGGVTRLLVEGGAAVAASLLRADLVDELAWFRAPSVIGGDGLPAVRGLDLAALSAAPRFERVAVEPLDGDLLERYRRTA